MALSKEQIARIENVLRLSLRSKLKNYKPETNNMPFHTRLLGTSRMALFSFIHSLNTTFGISVFEPVAIALSSTSFVHPAAQFRVGEVISTGARREIDDIINSLVTASSEPNKALEIERIRKVCQVGEMTKVDLIKADLKIERKDGAIYLFDVKTAKPNKGDFQKFKRTLLEWVAAVLASDPKREVHSIIAIPYNPYEPEPYARWTLRGMIDLKEELLVAEQFWDFLGGAATYTALLDVFERVGIELGPEIDAAFARLR